MNICLAGATGYLGQHLAVEMNKRGVKPTILTRRWDNNLSSKIETKDLFKVDFTDLISLNQKLLGVDLVISTLGITRQKDNLTYMDIDYQANLNLLNEAIRSGVKKFVYISSLNGDKFRDIKICQAKEKFVDALKNSNLEYLIIRPNGFYSDMRDFLKMANSGKVYLFSKGDKKVNPIHGEDLAKFCLDSLEQKNKELEVGGPYIYTHKELAKLAFKSLNKKEKICYIPDFIRVALLKTLPYLCPAKKCGSLEFFLKVIGEDMIAPKCGEFSLKRFFELEKDSLKL